MKKILFSFIIALSFLSCSKDKPRDDTAQSEDSATQFEDTEFFKAWSAVIEAQSQLKTSYLELEKIVNATPQADLSDPTKPKLELNKAEQAYWENHAKTPSSL